MIERKTTPHRTTHLTICNYEQYQHKPPTKGPTYIKRTTNNKKNAGARVREEAAPRPRINPITHGAYVETMPLATRWMRVCAKYGRNMLTKGLRQ